MHKFLYDAFTTLYPIAIEAVAPFKEKARLWTDGRKDIFEKIQRAINPGDNVVWMHCASLGEFEQGRPVLERLRVAYPDYKILLTFFSPSGYEVRKNYEGADYVFYLPMDSKQNAKRFFDIVQPKLAIFVKYEFWHYYLNEAKNRKVPLLLISAIFREKQPFFSKQGGFHKQMLSCFTWLFVQDETSVALLESIGFAGNVSIAGDTRFDRVIEIAERFEPIPLVAEFANSSDIVIAGSTWPKDDAILSSYVNAHSNVKFVIAPHNINKERINECLQLYQRAVLLSTLSKTNAPINTNTLIIDNVGMLSKLYKYGTVNFVGGGFAGDGVHNVLEAAVYGKPVVFGPIYEKYLEAIELVESTGGVAVANSKSFSNTLDELLKKDEAYNLKCKACHSYVYGKRGATQKIMDFIQEKRLLTS